jgi:hypothetical protein
MSGPQPFFDVIADLFCQFKHFCCLLIRYESRPLVTADVSLLAESIKELHHSGSGADGVD